MLGRLVTAMPMRQLNRPDSLDAHAKLWVYRFEPVSNHPLKPFIELSLCPFMSPGDRCRINRLGWQRTAEGCVAKTGVNLDHFGRI